MNIVNATYKGEGGWVWRPRRRPTTWDMDDHPVVDDEGEDAWEEESKQVQWFRAEAEFFRWLEQLERKHFEFLRLIRSFEWNANLWRLRSDYSDPDSAPQAFCSRQSDVYGALASDACTLFRKVAEPSILPATVQLHDITYEQMVQTAMEHRETRISSAYSCDRGGIGSL